MVCTCWRVLLLGTEQALGCTRFHDRDYRLAVLEGLAAIKGFSIPAQGELGWWQHFQEVAGDAQ